MKHSRESLEGTKSPQRLMSDLRRMEKIEICCSQRGEDCENSGVQG